MKDQAHIVTTDEFNTQWLNMLSQHQDPIYETYLGFYLRLRNQLNEPIEHPRTFGFLINTGGLQPAKSGVVFHSFSAMDMDPESVFRVQHRQRLLGVLEDHDLDFQYQKQHHALIQPMPNNQHMAVTAFYTPHYLTNTPEVRGNQFDDFAAQPAPSHQFYRLMNTHDNRVFAWE